MKFDKNSDVTCCLISCERPDLLKITLETFFKFNTYPIKRFIISEDSAVRMTEIEELYPEIEFLYNDTGKRYGMMRNLQRSYETVDTEYIFSLEEDWIFYNELFIERSKEVLEHDRSILQVWIRSIKDTNGHPLSDFQCVTNASPVFYRIPLPQYMGCFSGYSTNPSLKRLNDVVDFSKLIENCTNNGEDKVNEYYFKKGFKAAILDQAFHPEGYTKHIGYNRTVK